MGKLLPAMTQQKLDTQRDVVKNERRWSVDNQPYGTWWEKLPALAFPPEHPFHHSLIGSMEDLSAASLEDIEQFFATYYTPDNAVLSIAGDFDPAERASARRALLRRRSRAAAGRPPLPAMSVPPIFGGWKRETVAGRGDAAAALPRVALAGVRERRVLRGERARRGPRHAEGEPAAARAGARARGGVAMRRRSRSISPRARPARRRRHRAAGRRARERLEPRRCARSTSSAREGVREAEVQRAVALIETMLVSSMQSAGERAEKLSLFATYLGDPGAGERAARPLQRGDGRAGERVRAPRARRGQSHQPALRAARAKRRGRRRDGARSAPRRRRRARISSRASSGGRSRTASSSSSRRCESCRS